MHNRVLFASLSVAGIATLGSGDAFCQSYPEKPIRIFAGSPGGGDDFAARVVAQGISGALGQQVIVDNRATTLTAETVARSPPDGYTLLATGWVLWVRPLLQKAPFDPVKDFAPITIVARSNSVLTVHPSLPVRSVKELIALAKAKPGELNYGTGAVGTTPHLAAELFKYMARVDIVRVNYSAGGLALNDLIAGQVQLMFNSVPSIAGHVKSRRLRALAVTGAQPSALFPGLPTVAASGVPGYETVALDAILAPARTPATIISRLNREIVRVLSNPEVKERFLNLGVEVVGSSPDELAAAMKSDIARLGAMIRNAGIRSE
jgi:tripartite-type tricarboxylate transporter receptor subunit TctC